MKEGRLFRVVVVSLLLLILGILLDYRCSIKSIPSIIQPQIVEAENIQPTDAQQEQTDHTGNVGQTNDKIVTQKEPNSQFDPNNPPAPQTQPTTTPPVVLNSNPVSTTQPLQPTGDAPQVTAVAGVQDTADQKTTQATYPELGTSAPNTPEDGGGHFNYWWLLLLILPAIALILWLLYKRKDDEEE